MTRAPHQVLTRFEPANTIHASIVRCCSAGHLRRLCRRAIRNYFVVWHSDIVSVETAPLTAP